MANVNLTLDQRRSYLNMWARAPFFSIFQLVLGLADRSRLQGCMFPFRSRGSEVCHLQLRMSRVPLITFTLRIIYVSAYPAWSLFMLR
jgi:hypothetical protein